MGLDGFECGGWGGVHLVPVDFRELAIVAVELELDLAAEAHDGPGPSRKPRGAAVGSHAHAGAHLQRHAACVVGEEQAKGYEFIGRPGHHKIGPCWTRWLTHDRDQSAGRSPPH